MGFLIKWLCFLYFKFHKDTDGLLIYDKNFHGFVIKLERRESEDKK